MRVSYTPLAFAALLLVTACSADSPEIVAPTSTSANTTITTGGIGWSGSGNSIAGDSTGTAASTAERGIGWSGSGN